ncbi:MAG: outer membrane beta-barrel protein [Thermoanaerobaculales bacterium]|jgi:outer membrane protein|nr:outer membrane beta-barrel protein [Thermoanaerobaculales bacterium]
MTVRRLSTVLAALLALAAPALAEQGDTEVGFRALWVAGSATGDRELGDTGSSPTLSSGPGLEIGWVAWPLDWLTVELAAGASALPLETTGGSLGSLDLGTVWAFPLSAVAQYRPPLYGPFDPYVGIGLAYTLNLLDESDAAAAAFTDIELTDELGLVVEAGVAYHLDVRWSATLDLRYVGWETTGRFTSADGSVDESALGLDPWVVGLGFRYRF